MGEDRDQRGLTGPRPADTGGTSGPRTRTRARTPSARTIPPPSRPLPRLSAATVAGSSATLAIVRGEVDASAADHLCNELLGYLDLGRRLLLVDLSGVTFLDAAAVNALLFVARSGVRRDILTVLVGAPQHVRRVLETLNLQYAIPRAPSVKAALALADEAGGRDSFADTPQP